MNNKTLSKEELYELLKQRKEGKDVELPGISDYKDSFKVKIGGTTFQVNSFWDEDGKESVLQQFMDLISSDIDENPDRWG